MNRQETGNLIDLDDSPPPSIVSTPPISPPLGSTHQQQQSYQSSKPQPRSQGRQHPQHYHYPSPPPPSSLQRAQSQSQEHYPSAAHGIGNAVLGLWRRISALDDLPTSTPTPPLPTSQLYNLNSVPAGQYGSTAVAGVGDGINGAFTPPRRTASPRGLPSLEPLTLSGYRADTEADERLLSRGIAEEIRTFLPERLKIMEDWKLVYSLYQNGSSLGTLFQLCDDFRGKRAGFVLVVRDGKEGTFGAYLTEAPHPAASYYGTGECFLWRASLHAPLPPPPSADTTDLNYRTTTIASPTRDGFPALNGSFSSASHLAPGLVDPITNKISSSATQSLRFQNFAYSGANDYCIFCETKFLSVGGGSGGTYGLWLNDSLSRGHSAECDTFLNEPLSDEGEKFDVLGVELWVVGAT